MDFGFPFGADELAYESLLQPGTATAISPRIKTPQRVIFIWRDFLRMVDSDVATIGMLKATIVPMKNTLHLS
jgi:hypothetical protein